VANQTEYTVDSFISEAKALIAEKGVTDESLQSIALGMKRLVERTDLFQIGQHRGPGANAAEAYTLYQDSELDGPMLLLVKFDKTTAVHNHGSWGVLCSYQGREQYTQWDRLDDGVDPGKARLKVVSEREMRHGDTVYWLDVPNDIHRQAPIDGSAWELIYMGRNAMNRPREHYDPDAGTAWDGGLPAGADANLSLG
jgi:predicted metal-dependent enzyme (double-stranded beta helix superfamily)